MAQCPAPSKRAVASQGPMPSTGPLAQASGQVGYGGRQVYEGRTAGHNGPRASHVHRPHLAMVRWSTSRIYPLTLPLRVPLAVASFSVLPHSKGVGGNDMLQHTTTLPPIWVGLCAPSPQSSWCSVWVGPHRSRTYSSACGALCKGVRVKGVVRFYAFGPFGRGPFHMTTAQRERYKWYNEKISDNENQAFRITKKSSWNLGWVDRKGLGRLSLGRLVQSLQLCRHNSCWLLCRVCAC